LKKDDVLIDRKGVAKKKEEEKEVTGIIAKIGLALRR